MILAIGIIIFIIGCCIDSFEQNSYLARKEAHKRHDELLKAILKEEASPVKKTKVTRRRIAKDPQGNILAEEITEEVI